MSSVMGGDPNANFMASQYLAALQGSGQGIKNPLYTALSEKVGNDPSKLLALGNALGQQKYNPNMGSRGVNANAILAALGV